ncbi:MAG TPA: dTDP-4-dehydrorhamnose 3,5-epimerase [Verrucomicrobiota bacterium]|nr:dTDP-4-dehydrorhamnose 3,5-epimerase [Verrucomicrobiales bacterium]HRI12747.1 dTDP-4-dehydrorhamnose 3,5-epimerase [Verrucomicrobiota bacterium]
MKFSRTTLEGVWLIELEPAQDNRGLFSRTWCEREFSEHGLNTRWPQGNLTRTHLAGTIRGLHWQADPHPETKLIRCSVGAIWDVVVDLRRNSPSLGQWEAFELTEENWRQLYVPAGFAHGFQTLADSTEVTYLMSEYYFPELARGCRWDDGRLKIRWPLPVTAISDRDGGLPDLASAVSS